MEILSGQFALFVGAVLAVYYILSLRAQNVWLLLASYVFYVMLDWRFALVLLCVTTLSFWGAKWLNQSQKHRALFLWGGIGAALVLFAGYKSLDSSYVVPQVERVLSGWISPETIFRALILPVGFSFYILQVISYLVDVYQKRLAPCQDFIDFALYLAYFPKLISGPIERARAFLPILQRQRTVTNETLARALTLLLTGLVRKIVLADVLFSLLPKDFFGNGDLSLGVRWAGLLTYAFYLYNDFAAYTSLVRGVSLLFGIELSNNFQQPYFARGFSDFWNRWHISLSNWLRDYIFFPLSRALLRANKGKQNWLTVALPPLVTMVVSGLWHGFYPAMVLWGGLHGIYQAGERVLQLRWPRLRPQDQPGWLRVISALLTFLLVVLAWVPFGSLALRDTLVFWKGLFVSGATSVDFNFAAMGVTILLSVGLDGLLEYGQGEPIFLRWRTAAQSAMIVLAVLLIIFVRFWNAAPAVAVFVYQGF